MAFVLLLKTRNNKNPIIDYMKSGSWLKRKRQLIFITGKIKVWVKNRESGKRFHFEKVNN